MLHLTATGFLWKLPVSMLFLCSTGFCHYIMSATVASQPLSRRQALIHTAVMVAEMIAAKISIALLSHNTGAIMALIVSAFLARFLYGARGRGWLSLSLRLMLANVVMEMICALFIHLLTTLAHIPSGKLTFLSLETLMDIEVMALSCTMTSIAGLIYSGFIRLLRRLARSLRRRDSRTRVKTLGLYIRLICMLALGATMLAVTGTIFRSLAQTPLYVDMYPMYILLLLSVSLFLLVSLSYFLQDVRYLQQLSRNETLEREQAISRSLLTNLRTFRHNTINMLYGFEGAILSGDAEGIRNYYREMTERCAMWTTPWS